MANLRDNKAITPAIASPVYTDVAYGYVQR